MLKRLSKVWTTLRAITFLEWRYRVPRVLKDRLVNPHRYEPVSCPASEFRLRLGSLWGKDTQPLLSSILSQGLLEPSSREAAVASTQRGDLRWMGDDALCFDSPCPQWSQLPGFPAWPSGPSHRIAINQGSATHGDVRRIWNLGKCWHWPLLAWAAREGNLNARERLLEQWYDFIASNPVGEGILWAPELETAERALNWIVTLMILEDYEDDEVAPLLAALFDHGSFLHRRLTRWSWNHVIGEACVLTLLATLAPEPQKSLWLKASSTVLRRRVPALLSPSGFYGEKSPPYAFLVYQYLALAGPCLPTEDQAWLNPRLQALGQALSQLAIDEGTLPPLGDEDDATLLVFPPRSVSLWRHPIQTLKPLPVQAQRDRWVAPEGWGVLGFRSGALQVRLNADNPAIDRFIAPHVHDDVLQVLVWHHHRPVLIDGGTYSYTLDPKIRWAYRGPKAHNAPLLPDAPCGIPFGTFRWRRVPRGEALGGEEQSGQAHASATRRDGLATRHVLAFEGRVVVILDVIKTGTANYCWRFAPPSPQHTRREGWVGDTHVRVLCSGGAPALVWGNAPASFEYGRALEVPALSYAIKGSWCALVLTLEGPPVWSQLVPDGTLLLEVGNQRWQVHGNLEGLTATLDAP